MGFNRRFFVLSLCTALALLILKPASMAQVVAERVCRYSTADGWSGRKYQTLEATPIDLKEDHPSGIPQVVRRINQALRIQADFDIYLLEDEGNALAVEDSQGNKLLLLDAGFLVDLNRVTGTQWSAIQVIAHEVGHHIARFSDDLHGNELNADYWSGQILQRLGAAREVVGGAILERTSERATRTHPGRSDRIGRVELGWDHAAKGTIDFSFCEGC